MWRSSIISLCAVYKNISSRNCDLPLHTVTCVAQIGKIKGEVYPRTGHDGSEGGVNSFHHGAWWKAQYPLDRRLGGPVGRYGRRWKILPPPGFDLQTVHPVADGCACDTIRAHSSNISFVIIKRKLLL